MKAIYPPKGRAQEYGALACNLALACDHGCKYCFAPGALRKTREEFHDTANIKPRPGIIEALKREAKVPRYQGESIFLCFACDPGHPAIVDTTIEAIKLLNAQGVSAMILTKSASADALFEVMEGHPENRFGVSLTFCKESDSLAWEPKAAVPDRRIELLQQAYDRGIKTWVSMEPVISPIQSLMLVATTNAFVHHFKVGKLNHHPLAKEIDWVEFREGVTGVLEEFGCSYYIKRDLREAAENGG